MNIDENNSNILDALNGSYIAENNYIAQPESPILQAIQNGSAGGSIPPDYDNVKNQVATNTADIASIAQSVEQITNTINRLHDDYLDYEPISGGVCLDTGALPIDTSITLNGEYEFIVKGHTTTAGKGCLIGAYYDNNVRTTMQLLGSSNKLQGQWAANKELTVEQAVALGLPENYIFTPQTYKINKNGVFIKQGEDWLQLVENGGYSGTERYTPIYLLGDRTNHTAYHGVLYYAEIFDENKNRIAIFEPLKNKRTGEVVILYTEINIPKIQLYLKPISGSLKEFSG